eukprot:4064184-Heterocapsa_arctica.AAC.1
MDTSHSLAFEQGRWRCCKCARSAKAFSTIKNTPCNKKAYHSMFFVKGLFFCWKCGAYSRKVVRLLPGKCRAKPPRESHGRRTLAAIAAGRCPVTGKLFGERPFPVAGL